MKTKLLFGSLCAVLVVSASFPLHAEVKPSALFSDHMVLQGGGDVPVWGMADPGEKVTVKISGQTKSVTAGADGKWTVHLAKLKAGGPFEMTIAGKNTITVKDVLVGEVWLGGGQSNMVFYVSRNGPGHQPYGLLDEEKEIAAANYPQVRMFTVKDTKSATVVGEVQGEWKVATPENVPNFSALGYLFARDLNQALKVPVGVVLSAYGGSTAEAWLPREALANDAKLKPMLDGFDAREAYFKEHPGVSDADAPKAPETINARAGKPGPLRDPAQDNHQPTVLYNGMIAPIVPYAIHGVIWYQGESIVGGKNGVMLYSHVMDTVVASWRKLWGRPELPFYAVQLASLKNTSNNPMVREQQAEILKLKNTGMAVTVDIGDPSNVHPKNKEPLGDRLSRIALANVYNQTTGGKKLEFSGPMYLGMKVEGSTIRLSFTHAEGLKAAPTPNQQAGLFKPVKATVGDAAVPRGTPAPLAVSSTPDPGVIAEASARLHGFQIAGADGKFVNAEAKVEGSAVVVSSEEVAAPTAVRYAWDNYPADANLYNSAGLPAGPFRTDQMDALTPIAAEFTGH